MYKIHYTVLISFLFFLNTVGANAMEVFIKDLNNKTTKIKVSPNTTVREIKEEVELKRHIPVNQQRIVYASKQLEDHMNMNQIQAHQGSTLHLVIRLETVKNLKYGKIYTSRLNTRRETLNELVLPNNQANIDDYFLQLQIFIAQLDGLFKYDLPAGFMMEVGHRLNTLIPNLLAKNFFEDPNYLTIKAKEHLNEDLSVDLEEKVFSWKNDQEQLNNYILCRLAYNFMLFKILQDENIYSIDQRFFSYDNKEELIRLYNQKGIKPKFVDFAEKFKNAHNL